MLGASRQQRPARYKTGMFARARFARCPPIQACLGRGCFLRRQMWACLRRQAWGGWKWCPGRQDVWIASVELGRVRIARPKRPKQDRLVGVRPSIPPPRTRQACFGLGRAGSGAAGPVGRPDKTGCLAVCGDLGSSAQSKSGPKQDRRVWGRAAKTKWLEQDRLVRMGGGGRNKTGLLGCGRWGEAGRQSKTG